MDGIYDYGIWAVVLFSAGLFVFIAFRFMASQWRVEWCDYIALLVEVCCLPFLSYLIVAYAHLAYRVEAGMRELCGDRFDDYAKHAMVSSPSAFRWDAFLTASVPQEGAR